MSTGALIRHAHISSSPALFASEDDRQRSTTDCTRYAINRQSENHHRAGAPERVVFCCHRILPFALRSTAVGVSHFWPPSIVSHAEVLIAGTSNDIVGIVLDSPASGYRVRGPLVHDGDNIEGRVAGW